MRAHEQVGYVVCFVCFVRIFVCVCARVCVFSRPPGRPLCQNERDTNTGLTLNSSFLERVTIEENEDEGETAESVTGTSTIRMLPVPADVAAALPAGTPTLNSPESVAVCLDRGTLIVANTQSDELLEVHCACSCADVANASSTVVTAVVKLASLRRPRGVFSRASTNTEVYSRVYVVGGDQGEGYVAYYDFVDSQLHVVSNTGLGLPAAVLDDVQRPNATGKSTTMSMRSEGSISGLYIADTSNDELSRFECSQVAADYVRSQF